jgi:hypothetical protein
MTPGDQQSSDRAIANLIATYAELVEGGHFAGVGRLLANATFTGGVESVNGRDAIEAMLRENVIVYHDGTPRTKHITTNLVIEVDERAGTATSRAYFTALQAVPGLPLQPIVSGRYHDRFERRHGTWPHRSERRSSSTWPDLGCAHSGTRCRGPVRMWCPSRP